MNHPPSVGISVLLNLELLAVIVYLPEQKGDLEARENFKHG